MVRRAGMTICSDGAPNVSRRRGAAEHWDPNYLPSTAMRWGGRPVNADKIPYVVLPSNAISPARLGDIARVSYNGRSVYAIFAEVGPRDVRGQPPRGEGSMALARALGINADPARGGTPRGVTYEIIPGSGARHGLRNGGPRTLTYEQIQEIGRAEFARLQPR